ncbi:MAG: glycosyltransferase family 2 protein [Halobacteriaceae archaeon]
MDLSVVVPTLNSRDRLVECLNALGERAPDAEVIVVNGPSTEQLID